MKNSSDSYGIVQAKETLHFLENKGISQPEVGVVLGTGLGKFPTLMEVEVSVDYAEIPHFPVATVESHSGKLLFGTVGGKNVLAMQGRFHFYEGYDMKQLTFPIRVMKLMGVKALFLSNAAGALNLDYKKGDLMLISDHINLLPSNPLIGKNIDEWGPRFPDMSKPYNPGLCQLIKEAAEQFGEKLNSGVYVSVQGPMLETPAEYRFLRKIGADAVGMSTVPEVIVANHMGLPCAAVSVLTDECDPDNLVPVDIADIIAVAGKADEKLSKIFELAISRFRIAE
jgi:purine-nucleoside phosphorylase